MEPRPPSVLVVDDDEDIRETICEFLNMDGYACHMASWGPEGIALARSLRPDVILLDLMMPTQSGYDVLNLLGDDPATRSIPVVLMSARDTTSGRVLGYADGADAFLAKPFDLVELTQVIGVALRRLRRAGS